MPTFEYAGRDVRGGLVRGRVEADDDLQARAQLRRDGYFVTAPTHTMSATATLVARAAARQAAAFVVDHDATSLPSGRRLFTRAAVDDVDPSHVRDQLAELHARIYSELVEPDDPVLDDTQALFTAALDASGDARRAWTVTLTGMLSDLRAIYY